MREPAGLSTRARALPVLAERALAEREVAARPLAGALVDGRVLADAWDRAQHRSLTPEERMENAAELRARVYGADALDVRAAERAARLRT